jgi:hypothetical protein
MRATFRAAVSAALVMGSVANAQDFGDVALEVSQGKIVTGLFSKKDGSVTSPVAVFASVFGEDGFDAITSEPGFDAEPGTFPTGGSIGFTVLDGWKQWTGNGFEAASDEQLSISFLKLETIVAADPIEGFQLAVQPDGGWHRHFNFVIFDPIDGEPQPGIYLLQMQLASTDKSIQPSDPFWFVFNYNESSQEHQAAIDWVQKNLASPPCFGDLNGDGIVDGADLGLLLGAWDSDDPIADLNGDGIVDGADLGLLLGAWDSQCP